MPVDTTESSAGDDTAPEDDPPAPPRQGWRRWAMDTRPLRRPAYRRLWSSTIVTAVGSQLTAVAVPKQIYDITGSSAWVGYASLAGLLPLVVFALWGGAVADSVDRRKLLLVTNTGIAVTSVLFWVQAVTGLESVWRADGPARPPAGVLRPQRTRPQRLRRPAGPRRRTGRRRRPRLDRDADSAWWPDRCSPAPSSRSSAWPSCT